MPPRKSIGRICAEHLEAAKAAAVNAGRNMSWDDVAAVIDRCMASGNGSTLKSSDFGDRTKVPPTPAQVSAYAAFIQASVDGQKFCDFYQSKGWLVGKTRMKDWQAAVRTWGRGRSDDRGDGGAGAPKNYSSIG